MTDCHMDMYIMNRKTKMLEYVSVSASEGVSARSMDSLVCSSYRPYDPMLLAVNANSPFPVMVGPNVFTSLVLASVHGDFPGKKSRGAQLVSSGWSARESR